MNHKVIALVGMAGAGKSVVSDFFEVKGFASVYFGAVTREEVARRDLELNEKNEKMVREELRAKHGMAAYAILNLPKIEKALERGGVIIDGLYSWSEYKVLKEKLGDDLVVLAVFTPRHLRYERLSKRKIRPLTLEECGSRDYAEIENIEKGGPIAMADFTVINDGSVEHLIGQLDKLKIA